MATTKNAITTAWTTEPTFVNGDFVDAGFEINAEESVIMDVVSAGRATIDPEKGKALVAAREAAEAAKASEKTK